MKSYQAGVGDYLSVLTAQRTLWSAKTTLLSLQQTDLNNRITLWQSLAAAPVKLTRRATGARPLQGIVMARVSLSWALILGLLSGIGPLCTDFYLPALPEITSSCRPPAPRPSCR